MDEKMNNQVEDYFADEAKKEFEEPKKNYEAKQQNSTKMIAIIAVVVVAIVAILTFALGGKSGGATNENSSGGATNENSVKEAQFESANSAYNDIVSASEICIEIMDSIYGAWHFAIYKSDDYYGTSGIKAFADATNLTYSDIIDAFSSILGYSVTDSVAYSALEEFNCAVLIVEEVYKNKGSYSQAQILLDSAKESLKSVTSEYSDYTGYPTLKSFYSEVSSYLELV